MADRMWIHSALRTRFITADIAREIARLVTQARHGEEVANENSPLTVTADGDLWVVAGPARSVPRPQGSTFPDWIGSLRMVISSLDGQIKEYSFVPNLPWVETSFDQKSQE